MRPHLLIAMSLVPALAAGQTPTDPDLAFLEDLAETRGWRLGLPTGIKVTPDGSTVIFLRSPPRSPVLGLYAMDVATGKTRELITPEQLLKGAEETLGPEERAQRERKRVSMQGFTSSKLSRDGKALLIQLSGRAYVVPVAGGDAREVAGPDARGNPMFGPSLSPDGKSVAFVRADELWVAPVGAGRARQLTRGAGPNLVHGQAEFAAEEELDRHDGFWWSPDSRQLIYQETDTSAVERHIAVDAARPFEAAESQPYPRAGGVNAKIAFGVISAAGGKTTWINWDRKKFEYVERVSWQEGAPPTMVLRSRDHKELALVAVEPRTGAVRELCREHDDAWVETGQIDAWLRDGSGFLWSTDRRGGWQLELRKPDGTLVREVTAAGWGFKDPLHLDTAGRMVMVTRAPEPVEGQVWRVPLDGGEPRALTEGPDLHTALFARDNGAHVIIGQPRQGPPRARVVRADGTTAGEVPSVAEKPPFEVNLEVAKLGGFWTAIIRPRLFDKKKKYPVILDVYGGPSGQSVYPAGFFYTSTQWIADHGFIVVSADNRGTPGRGHDWLRAIKDAFATVPLDDQVKALQAMAAHEPAMDLGRVGVMGGSFGGFMAALAVMRRPDIFKAAVADAPVVNWKNYDTAYTERYLGVPPPAGSSDVYESNGLLPYVKNLSRPLLVIHGTADDNVHFSESLLLMDAVFRAGKSEYMELMPMVGLTHLFNDPTFKIRYWQRIFGFFQKHLK